MTILALSICGGIALWLLYLLASAYATVRRFQKNANDLPEGALPQGSVFEGRSDLPQLANGFLAKLASAAAGGRLIEFNLQQGLSTIAGSIRSMTMMPRALVGILILGALLVTLFNLQGSVATLGKAFRDLSNKQSTTAVSDNAPPVDTIQRAMGDVADTARRAFITSAWIISVAALGLLFTVAVQRKGARAFNGFSRWAADAYHDAIAAMPALDQQAQLAELNETLKQMAGLVSALSEMGQGMSTLAAFGKQMGAASEAITAAIERLPTNINSSIVQLSGQVVRGISESLEHHVQYLSRLVLIYGQQEMRMHEIHKYVDDTLALTKDVSSSLKPLATLPSELEKLVQSVGRWVTGSNQLNDNVVKLQSKVEALPTEEMRNVLNDLRSDTQTFGVLLAEMRLVSQTLSSDLSSLSSRVGANITTELFRWSKDWGEKFTTLERMVQERDPRQLAALLSEIRAAGTSLAERLVAIEADVKSLGADFHGQNIVHQLSQLESHLAQLTDHHGKGFLSWFGRK